MREPAYKRYIILSAFLILASINFVRTAYDILKSSKRLDDLKGEVAVMEGKKADLTTQLDYKKTPDYVEEKARNDLNMVKPGEKLLVFIEKTVGTSANGVEKLAGSNGSGENTEKVLSAATKRSAAKESNPLLWYKLIFDN